MIFHDTYDSVKYFPNLIFVSCQNKEMRDLSSPRFDWLGISPPRLGILKLNYGNHTSLSLIPNMVLFCNTKMTVRKVYFQGLTSSLLKSYFRRTDDEILTIWMMTSILETNNFVAWWISISALTCHLGQLHHFSQMMIKWLREQNKLVRRGSKKKIWSDFPLANM